MKQEISKVIITKAYDRYLVYRKFINPLHNLLCPPKNMRVYKTRKQAIEKFKKLKSI